MIQIIVARLLIPSEKGIFSLIAQSTVIIAVVFGLGLDVSTTYYISKKKFDKDKTFSSLCVFSIFVMIINIVILLILWFFNLDFLGLDNFYIINIFLVVPIFLLNNLNKSFALGMNDIDTYNLFDVMQPLLFTLFIVVIFFLRLSLHQVVVLWSISFILTCFVTIPLVIKKYMISNFTFNIDFIKNGFKFGIKSYLSNLIGVLNIRVDIYIISFFAITQGNKLIGIYSVAIATSETILMVSNSISTVLFPNLSGKNSENDKRLLYKALNIDFYISFILIIIMVILSKFLVGFLYGVNYIDATNPLRILLLNSLLLSLWNIINIYFVSSLNNPMVGSIMALISFMSKVLLNLLLFPVLGLNGISLSALISSIVVIIIGFLWVRKYVKLNFYKLFNANNAYLGIRELLYNIRRLFC